MGVRLSKIDPGEVCVQVQIIKDGAYIARAEHPDYGMERGQICETQTGALVSLVQHLLLLVGENEPGHP